VEDFERHRDAAVAAAVADMCLVRHVHHSMRCCNNLSHLQLYYRHMGSFSPKKYPLCNIATIIEIAC